MNGRKKGDLFGFLVCLFVVKRRKEGSFLVSFWNAKLRYRTVMPARFLFVFFLVVLAIDRLSDLRRNVVFLIVLGILFRLFAHRQATCIVRIQKYI